MSFLSGSVTYQRFGVSGENPGLFDDESLAKLREKAAGQSRMASADGIDIGWSAGKSVLDLDFTGEKNIYPGYLAFELRIATDKLPADLLKAYYEVELKALTAMNPSGLPSARNKREAKEAARDRLEAEAKDGRFRKRKCVPVLWDAARREVLFGTNSVTHAARFCQLFHDTFDRELTPITSGSLAKDWFPAATPAPSPFIPGVSAPDVAWVADNESWDFLGNEFALWLWHWLETESDSLATDGGETTAMVARKLVLDCPRGMTGRDAISHEGPTRLPEAKRAIQAGKLPRSLGLLLVRHDSQFGANLEVGTFGVGGAKLPPVPEDIADAREKVIHRLTAAGELSAIIDDLYRVFLGVRLDGEWATALKRMQAWLARVERMAA